MDRLCMVGSGLVRNGRSGKFWTGKFWPGKVGFNRVRQVRRGNARIGLESNG